MPGTTELWVVSDVGQHQIGQDGHDDTVWIKIYSSLSPDRVWGFRCNASTAPQVGDHVHMNVAWGYGPMNNRRILLGDHIDPERQR